MDSDARMHDVLERLLHDKSAKPCVLPLSLLRAITNDFADDRKIRSGGIAMVYKGVLRNGTVAVKRYEQQYELEKRFQNELGSHMGLKDKNIVRLLGYCAESQLKMMNNKGKMVLSQQHELLLCFEYLRGGNLRPKIVDASCGLGWKKRYKIIKGICEGLSYLHQNRTIHLDLNPDNICLDEKKLPKILDFCCSRRIEEKQSKVILEDLNRSTGYMAPEILENRVATFKTDIYSLGHLIMDILGGHRGYCAVGNVLKSWADRLGTSLEDTSLEQIRVCAEIAMRCWEGNAEKRPDADHIIDMLAKTERMHEFTELDETESADEFTTDDYGRNVIEEEQTMELNILERVVAGSEEPSHLDLSLLMSITENFAKQRKIGVGGCGDVYKGVLRNGIVAVKRLFNSRTIKDKMFHREVQSLIMVRHENIVRFLGYCSFTEERVLMLEGRTIMADIRERLLCFEYISNGNLENHLTDELRGLEWHTRYEIIVGICKGLFYLHKERGIIHMDLKPANILLDDRMVPKITDFGLSRFDNNSHTKTSSRLISLGYCAPEYIEEGKSSSKSDIYSLGVMIRELVTGTKIEPDLSKVLRRWRHRWIKSSKQTPLVYQQVTKCLELAQRCTQNDPTSRPDIVDIIHELNSMDSNSQFMVLRRWRHNWIKSSKQTPLVYQQVRKCLELAQRCTQNDPMSRPDIVDIIQEFNSMDSNSQFLVLRRRHRWIKSSKQTPLVYQQVTICLELAQRCTQNDPTSRPDIVDMIHELNAMNSKDGQFLEIPCLDDMLGIEPLEINFPFELDLKISHSIELTNDTDDYIAFMTTAMLRCFQIEPDKGIVPPRSKCSVTIKMQAQVPELLDNHYKKIIVQSTIVDGSLATMNITGDVFIENEGTVVNEVNVMVVFDKPPLAEESSKDV